MANPETRIFTYSKVDADAKSRRVIEGGNYSAISLRVDGEVNAARVRAALEAFLQYFSRRAT
jgi:hypothetical protein